MAFLSIEVRSNEMIETEKYCERFPIREQVATLSIVRSPGKSYCETSITFEGGGQFSCISESPEHFASFAKLSDGEIFASIEDAIRLCEAVDRNTEGSQPRDALELAKTALRHFWNLLEI